MNIPENDINSLIESLPKEMEAFQSEIQSKDEKNNDVASESSDEGYLWNQFIDCLNDSDEDDEDIGSKSYDIDDDIIFTLQQCDFGKPKVYVINSILRAFIIGNVSNLKKILKPKRISLIDKYNTD